MFSSRYMYTSIRSAKHWEAYWDLEAKEVVETPHSANAEF